MTRSLFWAPQAWVQGQWQTGVCLEVDAQGRWSQITADVAKPPQGATLLAGPVLPGMVNAHSHAFQRAFAGLAERRTSETDDFWSWRDRMYGVALRVTPSQIQAIAAQLYVEMLQGGYTQVCEFHYLHHQEDGSPYADPATMAWALADAAQQAGLGFTLLPVLYERAGFTQATLRPDQRRFASTPALVAKLQRDMAQANRPLANAGVAIHSLRAASPESIRALLAEVGDAEMPIHIHVAEQMQEVNDCIAHTGQRPLEWLVQQQWMDTRWQLVHATHATGVEINGVAKQGAGIVICPSTEGNLGDGLTDLPGWLQAGVPMAIGSDSHVSRQWPEELRWLEYGQRLNLQRRNVSASPAHYAGSTAERLFDAALSAGGPAAGQKTWGLVVGARADALVLDMQNPGLLGVPVSHTLDALLFATDRPALKDVYVAGRQVIADGRHTDQAHISARFAQVMDSLWH
ncbi:MAG: formimidoylglutamate deiminase [Rhodoferax sp.]|nr:formimidoylglutamate deiminase [Rhodoferax sp.]